MQKKRKLINFRVTDKELMALNFIAVRENLNLSETLRKVLREAVEIRGLPPIGEIEQIGSQGYEPQNR
jgi:hypothetical protein